MGARSASRSRAAHRAEAVRGARGGWLPPALVLLGAIALCFGATLGAGFTVDDQQLIVANPLLREGGLPVQSWARSVRSVTLLVDHALFGLRPAGYHAHSLLWHLAAALLVRAFALRVTGRPGLALGAALLFAIHPAQVEAVANVSNRKEAQCLVFCLLAFLAWARAVAEPGRRLRFAALAAAAWLLALLSKQVAAALPLAVVAWEALCVPRASRLALRRPALLLAAGVGAGLGLVWYLSFVVQGADSPDLPTLTGYAGEASWRSFVLTAPRSFWTYLGLLAWPAGLCPDHLVTLSQSALEPATLAAGIALALGGAAAVAFARVAPVPVFGLAWGVAFLLPVSNLVPTANVLADRYLYAPLAGFSLAAAWAGHALLARLQGRVPRTVALACLAALAALLVVRTHRYAARWHDERSVWQTTLACNPDSYRAHYGLGQEALHRGDPSEALLHFDRAARLRPDFAVAHYNRAGALISLGRFDEALAAYDVALARWPAHAEAWYNRGLAHAGRGDAARAIDDYSEALRLRPDFAAALYRRGVEWLHLGRRDEARADLIRAAELGSRDAHRMLGLDPGTGHAQQP
jgi:tetratricopeptide (TPR) repeat protein